MENQNTPPSESEPSPPPPPPPPPPTPQKKQIFVLSGQSNMSGRGGVDYRKRRWDGVVPGECQPHPTILRLSADLHWEAAHEPLHFDIEPRKVCGVGPGMSFANAVRERVGPVALVPCAVGSTAIKEWARGQHLYENMVKRAKASVADGEGEIMGLLWFQGESDTSTLHDAEAYQLNMETLIHNVRLDLSLPHLPIIQVALASGDKYLEKVREAQLSINIENVVCVDAKGLQLCDPFHLTTEAQVQLGSLLAQAYLSHFGTNVVI